VRERATRRRSARAGALLLVACAALGAQNEGDPGAPAAREVWEMLSAGELDRARAAISEARSAHPDSLALALAEVETRIAVGDLAGARALVGSARSMASDAPARSQVERLATVLLGDPLELRRRIGDAPGDPWPLVGLGLVLLDGTRPELALPPLRMALDVAPGLALPRALLLQVAPSSVPAAGQPPTPDIERALEDLRAGSGRVEAVLSGLGERPFHLPAHLALIEAAERGGDTWRGLRGRRQLRRWLGPIPRFDLDAARAALRLEVDDLAACLVAAAREVGGDTPESLELAARVAARDAPSDALELARRAERESGPAAPSAELMVLIGDLEYRRMRIDEAVAALARAIELRPEEAETVASFALSMALAERLGSVRERLEAHLERHPESVNVAYALARLDLREGRLEQARQRFERLAVLLPAESQVLYNLGLVHRRLGDAPASERALEGFRRLEAEERERWEERNRVDRRRRDALDAVAAGRALEAAAIHREIVASGLAGPADLVAAGQVSLELGEWRTAAGMFAEALRLRPTDRAAIRGHLEAVRLRGEDEEGLARSLEERLALLEPREWGCPAAPR
jgi:tetratricopeptide (TPR) repeat protein